MKGGVSSVFQFAEQDTAKRDLCILVSRDVYLDNFMVDMLYDSKYSVRVLATSVDID